MYSKTYTLENGIRFDDADVVNPKDYDPDAKGELDMPNCGNLPGRLSRKAEFTEE